MPFNTTKRESRPTPFGRDSRVLPFGHTTERFFAEGEQHEAANWEDTILPPDDEPEPRPMTGSFDTIPRRRGATVGLVLAAACLGGVVGLVGSFFIKAGHKVDSSADSYTRETQAAAPTGGPVPPAGMQPGLPTAAHPDEAPSAPTRLASPPAEAPPTPTIDDTHDRTVPGKEKAVPARVPTAARPRPSARPLHDYVWSPAVGALVPASSWAASAGPATRAPVLEPSAQAAASTGE